jgi:hypothetical protein
MVLLVKICFATKNKIGLVHFQTYNFTSLQFYKLTILQAYNFTSLQFYKLTILQAYKLRCCWILWADRSLNPVCTITEFTVQYMQQC